MCYMERVGIRELRQNLSVHLRRVKRGEALEVTEHGRPVAVLGPLPEPAGVRARLLAEGKLKPATASLAELGPPPRSLRSEGSVSAALEEQRSERL